MSQYKIITVSGQDRVGKETQTKLLQKALKPSTRMSFPNYEHWSGKIIRALLYGDSFSLTDVCGKTIEYKEERHHLSFQYLQEINRLYHQNNIKETLKSSHIIMDRYDVDSIVYGLADGCDLKLLLEFDRQRLASDIAIILTGTSLYRNEKKDQYETDTGLQIRARNNYLALVYMNPTKYTHINVDNFARTDSSEEATRLSIFNTHKEICSQVSSLIGQKIPPLDYAEITYKV